MLINPAMGLPVQAIQEIRDQIPIDLALASTQKLGVRFQLLKWVPHGLARGP